MSYSECHKKENIPEHIKLLSSVYPDCIITNKSDEHIKNYDLDLITTDKIKYQLECKSDSSRDDETVLVELLANWWEEDEGLFNSKTFKIDHCVRKELEIFVCRLHKTEKYRSTACQPFSADIKYLFSYLAKEGNTSSYYVFNLLPLAKYARKNWKNLTLIVNKEDSCSIMVKIPVADVMDYLIAKKDSPVY